MNVKYLIPFLIFFVTTMFGSTVLGIGVTFLVEMTGREFNIAAEQVRYYSALLSSILGPVVGFFCFRWAVRRFILPQVNSKEI